MKDNEPGLRNGIYSYREAANILCVAPQRVSRWADGYTFPRKHGVGESRPVLQTSRQYRILTFLELWELMFVKQYIALGVKLPQIRGTAEALAKEVGEYPFSRSDILVHGRQLLTKTADGFLKRADIGQLVADYAEKLVPHIELRQETVGRYNIPEFKKVVYLDKDRRGGEPVVSERAIPTRLVYSMWEQEEDIKSVAEYYDLPEAQISAAIRYEGLWRLAA
ncbi:MAG: DUF433 domain-containing protein [Fimbriimonadaceae bacterium]